jgi:hypothetical protein
MQNLKHYSIGSAPLLMIPLSEVKKTLTRKGIQTSFVDIKNTNLNITWQSNENLLIPNHNGNHMPIVSQCKTCCVKPEELAFGIITPKSY